MRYGLPYKGSKNSIAEWVVNQLPKAEIFVDLFFGGGAITHRAMLTGKYKRFIINDIDGRLPKLFIECAYGKHTVNNHSEWISREEFHAKKDIDAYIALVWSFGNNGKDYIYGEDIERFKHDYHRAVFEDKPELLLPYGYRLESNHAQDPYDRYLFLNRQIQRIARNQLEVVTRQIEIERLQSLQSLQSDYAGVPIPEGALIYCDIPYGSTNCGKYDGFDSQRFYEWAERQENIFISEYNMPDCFIPIAETEKVVLSAANGNSLKAVERLYTNKKTYNTMSKHQKDCYILNMAQQMSFF